MCLRSFPNSSAGCSLRWIPTIAHYRLHTRVFESLGLVNLVLVGALHLLVLHFFYQPYSFPTMSDATELTPALKRNRITISELTHIQEPNTTTLLIMNRELSANTEAVPTIDNAPNGHLGSTMPVAEYTAKNNSAPYGAPVFPVGPGPLIGSHAVVEETKRGCNRAVKINNYHKNATEHPTAITLTLAAIEATGVVAIAIHE